MGRIGRVLNVLRARRNNARVTDVQVDPGGGANVTGEQVLPPGYDGIALDDDYSCAVEIQGTGREAIVGYADTRSVPRAGPGDARIYARSDATTEAAQVWTRANGTIVASNANGSFTLNPDGSGRISNGSGSFELQAGGTVVINGVQIDPQGNITTNGDIQGASVDANSSLTVNGFEVAAHTHTSTAPGSPTGPMISGPPVP